jgi:hypothetical protein
MYEISDQQLSEWDGLCEKATAGPWVLWDGCSWRRYGSTSRESHSTRRVGLHCFVATCQSLATQSARRWEVGSERMGCRLRTQSYRWRDVVHRRLQLWR